jgi:hypothetical protein
LSLIALGLVAATYFYLRHVNGQLPWRLSEDSSLSKWLTKDAEGKGSSKATFRPLGY